MARSTDQRAPVGFWDALGTTATRHGDQPAIVRGTATTTFAELHQGALDAAHFYASQGVATGDRILLLLDNTAAAAAALLGAWGAGAIPALLDVDESAGHIAHGIATVTPRLVLHPGHVPVASNSPTVVTAAFDRLPTSVRRDPVPFPPIAATDPASIVFTSGSTGKPKGATQSHGSLVAGCRTVADYLGLRPTDRILCPVPWSYDYGFGQLLSSVLTGCAQILPEARNPFAVCAGIATHRPTVLAATPAWLGVLLGGMSPLPTTDVTSLRMITSSGGKVPPDLVERTLAAFPACSLVLNYGLTESYRTSYLAPELVRERPGSIGRAMPGVDLRILREDSTEAATGEVGEITHRGIGVFLGYWGDPVASARALRPDPLAAAGDAGKRLFTGDYGYRDEQGFVVFVGRRDRQLKPMGVRVGADEVEELLRASDLVAEVAVFALDRPLLGHEVWAAVVPTPSTGLATGPSTGDEQRATLERQLDDHARQTMTRYMQPRRYVILAVLPRTRSGKIDYPALVAQAQASIAAPPDSTL